MDKYKAADVVSRRVIPAMAYSLKVHGPMPLDLLRASNILTAETGEGADAVLGATRVVATDTYEHVREELAQVAAVAILILMNLEG